MVTAAISSTTLVDGSFSPSVPTVHFSQQVSGSIDFSPCELYLFSGMLPASAAIGAQPEEPTDKVYDLAGILNLALTRNPYTRKAWQTAVVAAAESGEARAPYYPKLSFRTTLGELRTAAGVAANASLRVKPLPMAVPDPFAALQDKLDSLVDAALVNRPDLAGKVADLRAQEAATMRAKADFFPEIRFEGTYHCDTFDFRARDPATKARGFQTVLGLGS